MATLAKISLSDEDAGRGTEITVTGTGFNNGTNAEVYVLVADTAPASCQDLVTNSDSESLGAASVGSDDKFTVTFTVHQDEFDPGPVNHICAVDSEAGAPRFSSDVDTFELEPSVTVDPASANFGDEVTVKPRDFPGAIESITLGPTCAWTAASGDTDCFTPERDGSDFVFDLPGGLDERIQIAVAGRRSDEAHLHGCGSLQPQSEPGCGSRSQREHHHLRQRLHRKLQHPRQQHHH